MAERRLPQLPPLLDDETRTLEQAAPTGDEAPPEKPRRRPRPDDEGPPRKLWSAGHALVVCVLALAIGLLLNAPGIHKSAYNKPAGWQRDVALAVTGPLAGVSGALLLDRPREGVQALVGRSGNDEIHTDLGLPAAAPVTTPVTRVAPKPTGSSAPTPGKAAAPRKLAFSPKKKLRIWIAGDSLVITPGYAIVRAAGPSPALETVGSVDGRVATGLTRPDVFNWFDEIRRQAKELRPKAVVLAFGGNDDKAYMTGLPDGASIGDFGSWAWRKEYGRRVGGVMDALNRAGAFVIWIGLPQTRDADQTRRFDVVNSVVVKQARKRPGRAAYIDTYTAFAGDDGGYAEYLAYRLRAAREGSCGRRRPLRARGRGHHRPPRVEGAQQGVRPHQLAQETERLAGRAGRQLRHDSLSRPRPRRAARPSSLGTRGATSASRQGRTAGEAPDTRLRRSPESAARTWPPSPGPMLSSGRDASA